MNKELSDLVETVDELNELLPENSQQFFTISYSSYWMSVSFGDIHLWDSENDDREFDEDKNDWEPMLPYLKKVLHDKVEELIYLTQ